MKRPHFDLWWADAHIQAGSLWGGPPSKRVVRPQAEAKWEIFADFGASGAAGWQTRQAPGFTNKDLAGWWCVLEAHFILRCLFFRYQGDFSVWEPVLCNDIVQGK